MCVYAAKRLGLQYLSPYLDSIGANFRHGANFAIGGSTIRRQNESYFLNGVSPFPLDIQVVQFTQFKSRTGWFYNQGKSFHLTKSLLTFMNWIKEIWLCTFAAKKSSIRRNLPRPEDFSKALYVFDIGQNDLAAGFRTMNIEKFKAEIPDIINQFATAVQVSNSFSLIWLLKFVIRCLKGVIIKINMICDRICTNKGQGHFGYITPAPSVAWLWHCITSTIHSPPAMLTVRVVSSFKTIWR